MKKLVATILCAALCLGFAGCTHSVTKEREVEKTYEPYSKIWTAQDDGVEHNTGDPAIDDGWGALLTTDSKPGYLCRAKTETLTAPAYTAAARLLVQTAGTAKTVVAVLRVLDGEGKELGRRNVRVCDFEADFTYQDFVFTFPVEKSTEATFEIYWPGTQYVRVSEFGIMSKNGNNMPDYTKTGADLLGKDIQEEGEIVFEEDTLYYFDLLDYMMNVAGDAEEQYDIANLVCTLQGLANRDGERLFVRFMQANGFSQDTDSYWLGYLTEEGSGRWLDGKKVVTVKSPMTLLKLFENYYTGFAAWDPAVPATVNAAATACGVEDLLPVRYSTVKNSLYHYICNAAEFAGKPVKVDLGGKFTGTGTVYGTDLPSTGSRKNDAYLWAKAQYLDTHKTNSHMMAYHVDAYGSNTVFAAYSDLQNMFLSNRDYYIMNKTFFFDLSPMEFETPDDDPDQANIDAQDGTIDYRTFEAVMKAQAAYAESVDPALPIDVGGFTPWHLKYTRYTNPQASGEVDYEWETVYQFSIYNAYVNADAPGYTAMANASIYSKYPLKESYAQKGKFADAPIEETLPTQSEQGANYLLFYVGDFDASSWLNTAMIKFWNDPVRTDQNRKMPLCWTFALNISKRAPHVIDMMYETATEYDYFVAGDNGVGYLNPMGYDDARSADVYGDLDSWAAYNKTVYGKFDIEYTGFLITRASAPKEVIEAYAKFCKGTATNYVYNGDSVEGIEVVSSFDYTDIRTLVGNSAVMKVGDKSTFRQVRFILRTPEELFSIYTQLTSETYKEYNFKIVDPYTFYTLLAQQNNG